MIKGIFITATGTDVGKTYITGELIRCLQNAGMDAGYYKAALSGTALVNGEKIAGDSHYIYQMANLKGNPNDAVTNVLDFAASPHLSAKIENKPITLAPILKDYAKMSRNCEVVVMEGSGGLVCPLNLEGQKLMLTDVIKALKLDILLVAPAGLGTINSTMLTLFYANHLKIKVRGIILNHYNDDDLIHRDNLAVLKALTNLDVITCKADGSLGKEVLALLE